MSYNIGDTIIDGTTQYTIKEFVAFSNTSTIIKSIRILRDIDTQGLNIYGGTDYGHGANLVLRGKDHNTEPGFFNINAHDGTKVKTLLGTADGTLTWNNENIMTDKKLGYRQPNTSYSIGDIAYHNALPTGLYLECTTAGTTSSGELSISSLNIGGTVSDGTVIWKIGKSLSVNGGAMYANVINRNVDNADILICGGTNIDKGAYLLASGKDNSNAGSWELSSSNGTKRFILRGNVGDRGNTILRIIPDLSNPNISYDLGGSAITTKSFVLNGYIKYASGLIMQWGSNYPQDVVFPISFTSYVYVFVTPNGGVATTAATNTSLSGFTLSCSDNFMGCSWISIGY